MKRMGIALAALALSALALAPTVADAQETMGPTMTGTSGSLSSGSTGTGSLSGSFTVDADASDLVRATARASQIGRRYGQTIVSDHDTILLSSFGLEGRLESGQRVPASFTVTRFDRDANGRLVAHGVVTSAPVTPSLALSIRDRDVDLSRLSAHERALMLSSPLEPSVNDYTPEELGLSSDVTIESDLSEEPMGLVGDGSGMPMDEYDAEFSGGISVRGSTSMDDGTIISTTTGDAAFGSWTGISAGYGESGVGASVDIDGVGGISGLTDDETLFSEPSLGLSWRSDADAIITSPSLTVGVERESVSEVDDEVTVFNEAEEIIVTTPYAYQEVTAPVTIVSSSCDHLTLGLGDVLVNGTSMSFNQGTVTITSRPGDDESKARLCAIADTYELDGNNVDVMIDPLNGLIITTE